MLYKLESWRGMAAIAVVLFHSPFNYYNDKISFINNSYLFVDLFFILSGFVMSFVYTAKIREGGLSFLEFSFLRLARLYPLHLFMLLSWLIYLLTKELFFQQFAIGSPQFSPETNNNLVSFFKHLFLLNGIFPSTPLSWNGPSWSISVEFFTYIIFYLFVISTPKKSLMIPLIFSILFYMALFLLKTGFLEISIGTEIVRCLAGFSLGIYIHRLKQLKEQKLKTKNEKKLNVYVLEIFSISLLCTSITLSGNIIFEFISILSMGIIIYVFSDKNSGSVGKVLETKYLKLIGKWSFSIYMVHSLVISVHKVIADILFPIGYNNLSGYITVIINFSILVMTILVSIFTFKFIEDKFRNKSKETNLKKILTKAPILKNSKKTTCSKL
ncbi:acyltransferase [Paraglaciecola sp. L3A3]|uniref:acyltransferase family protein n=1 Tax=Paraglaciecola sp. L3A3 TaxID=2686358 RepID=UPI00210723C3|nr:acyltransferase [Paraglaciecola sp. L3A3]